MLYDIYWTNGDEGDGYDRATWSTGINAPTPEAAVEKIEPQAGVGIVQGAIVVERDSSQAFLVERVTEPSWRVVR